MVDFNKISASVQQEIKTISGMGGNKKKIDSADEFAALQQLGQKLETTGSNSEKEYVAGLMIDYQNQVKAKEAQAAERRQSAEVTPAAREAVKSLKKMMPNKKELDEPEARMLLDLIKNTRGDYNAADIEYFKQELIKAGFGALLNEFDDKTKTESAPNTSTEQQPPKADDAAGEPVKQDTPAEQPPKADDAAGEPVKQDTPAEQPPKADDAAGEPVKQDTPAEQPPKVDNGANKPAKPPKKYNPNVPPKFDDGVGEPAKPPKKYNPNVPPKFDDGVGKPAKPPKKYNPEVPPKVDDGAGKPAPAKPKPKTGDGLRFKKEDVPNRALLIDKASRGFGTDERMFIDNVTVGAKRDKSGRKTEDKYLHGRQPFNAAEARAIDKQLREMTGKGLLQYMSEEFKIGGGGGNDQFITQLYRQYITYGLKQ